MCGRPPQGLGACLGVVGGRGRARQPLLGSGSFGGPAGPGGGSWGLGSRGEAEPPAASPGETPLGSSLITTCQSLFPLQPHLPPDLSKQGKVLQTWQSPSLAEADSCQGSAGAGAGLARQGEWRARRGGAVAALHAHLELKGSPHPPTATLCADCGGAHGHPEQGRAQLKGPAAERLLAPAAVLEGALGLGVGMGLGLTLAFLQTPCVTCPNPMASSNAHTGAGGLPSSWVILIP